MVRPKFCVGEVVNVTYIGTEEVYLHAVEIINSAYVYREKIYHAVTRNPIQYTGWLYTVDASAFRIIEEVLRKRPDLHKKLSELERLINKKESAL